MAELGFHLSSQKTFSNTPPHSPHINLRLTSTSTSQVNSTTNSHPIIQEKMFTACSWRSSGGLGRLVRVRTFLPTKHGIVRFVAAAGRCYSRHSLNEKEYPSPTGQSKHSGLSGIHLSPHQIPHIHLIANPHDVLISDVQHETLETTIATELGITYLSKVSKEIQRKVFREAYRYLYGPNDRAIIPLPVISGNTALWVFFVIDSGAPNTHISPQVSLTLGIQRLDIGVLSRVGVCCPWT